MKSRWLWLLLVWVALAGAQEGKRMDIRSLILDIRPLQGGIRHLEGLSAGIAGGGRKLEESRRDIDQTLADLGAEVREREIAITLSGDILFDFDSAAIRPDAEATLRRVAEVIRARRRGDVLIHGHTDAKGSEAYNLGLSRRRAEAVRDWLVRQAGLDPAWLKTQGFGESRPVAPNTHPDGSDNPAGRQKNRRVEIFVQTVGPQ